MSHIFHLFGIHNDLFQKIKETQEVTKQDADHFLAYQHGHYFELGLKMLLDALNIKLRNLEDLTQLMTQLGYVGKVDKIFRELSVAADKFTSDDVLSFLNDNEITVKKLD